MDIVRKNFSFFAFRDQVCNNLNCTGDKISSDRTRKCSMVKSIFKHLTPFRSADDVSGSNNSIDNRDDILNKISANTSDRKTSFCSGTN